ncbi:MAG: hypothetical protein OHK0038_28180 [Flammeovirgaceae bacterium]
MRKRPDFGFTFGYDIPKYPFKIDLDLWEKIEAPLFLLVIESNRVKKNGEWLFLLSVNFAAQKLEKANILGPHKDRRNKILSWAMWMPSEKIIESPEPLRLFFKYFFEGLIPFMKQEFEIEEDKILQLQEEIEKEYLSK